MKFMMLISSMSPLFLLVAIRGMDKVFSEKVLWIITVFLIIVPYLVIRFRILRSKKSNDTFILDVTAAKNNKEYLFTFLFTVLLPLYSVSIEEPRDCYAVLAAILLVIFILWNLNLHFINIVFAIRGYRVYTIENDQTSILLTKRHSIPKNSIPIKVHRLSNSVFIEIKE